MKNKPKRVAFRGKQTMPPKDRSGLGNPSRSARRSREDLRGTVMPSALAVFR
jgi:hypothetical protein